MERTKKDIERHNLLDQLHNALIGKAVAELQQRDTKPSDSKIHELNEKLKELENGAVRRPTERGSECGSGP
jgi:hypothetical protein